MLRRALIAACGVVLAAPAGAVAYQPRVGTCPAAYTEYESAADMIAGSGRAYDPVRLTTYFARVDVDRDGVCVLLLPPSNSLLDRTDGVAPFILVDLVATRR